jgi:hypothetical protein
MQALFSSRFFGIIFFKRSMAYNNIFKQIKLDLNKRAIEIALLAQLKNNQENIMLGLPKICVKSRI